MAGVNPEEITIVIPTLNEAPSLRNTILHTQDQSTQAENLRFIVVDAGSIDRTLETITDLPVESVQDETLRGKKYASLNRGLEMSEAPITLFLDADTLLPAGFDTSVRDALRDQQVVGGAFSLRFANPDWRLRLLRFINHSRYTMDGIYYGDQAIFCQTSIAKELGGYPAKALMEAAFFCQQLKSKGRLALIRKDVTTSPRRFQEGGFFKVVWFDIRMWFRFTVGWDVTRFAKRYWESNAMPRRSP